MEPEPAGPSTRPVPWRTIFATVAVVLGTLAAILVVRELHKIIGWLAIAAFLAVVLNPAVDFLEHRAKIRRGLSTLIVFIVGFSLFAAMMYAFIRPIVDQSQTFADRFPTYVQDAKAGKGPAGKLVKKYKLDQWVEDNQDRLQEFASSAGKIALKNAPKAASFVAAFVTILVLAFLMLVEGPDMLRGFSNALSPRHRERVRRVADDCARTITGYMFGNLLISVIAGIATYVALWVADVPFRGVLSLWVAFADLIPLVGATLGAIPTIAVAFLHSVPAGIGIVIFYIVYQQFENHVLQVTIMARTVALNPLLVLVSVLVGVELLGVVGALLAIPAGGIIQVIGRDLWDEHRGEPKDEPTVGAEELPVDDVEVVDERA
jgi:predicted PurR-regulated permease PerM